MSTVPSLLRQAAKVKDRLKSIDAKFLGLPSPGHIPKGATPGEILMAGMKPAPDYIREIEAIWRDVLAPMKAFETEGREVDEYAAFLVKCVDHTIDGSPIGRELDSQVADWAKTIWKARKAQILDTSEVHDSALKNKDDLRESMTKAQEVMSYGKKYRRTAKNALLNNTSKTLKALVQSKQLMLSGVERSRLKKYAERTENREALYSEIYRKTYYRKGNKGHLEPRPVRMKSLEVLRHG